MSVMDDRVDGMRSTQAAAASGDWRLLIAAARKLVTEDAQASVPVAHQALAAARGAQDALGEIDAQLTLGDCANTVLDYAVALDAYARAAQLAEAQGDQARFATALRSSGFVLDNLGDFARALDFQVRAFAIDEAMRDPRGRALSLRTIGISASKAGDAARGLAYYRESLALLESVGDEDNAARTRNNMGINLKNLGQYEESHAQLSQALTYFERAGLTGPLAGAHSNMARTLTLLGRHNEAEAAYGRAIALAQQSGYSRAEITGRTGLAELYIQQGRIDPALTTLERALVLAEQSQMRPELADVHRLMALAHKARGDAPAALAHHETYHELDKSLFNAESARRMAAMEAGMRLEQLRREAAIEREKAVALEQANALLQAAGEEKSRLLAELERQSREDALTGVANRRQVDERLAQEFKRAKRQGTPLALAMADIDYFKHINDRHSHATGDLALKAIAAILRTNCRDTDLVGRYGGEEFVLAFTGLDATGALAVCEKIRRAVETHDFSFIQPGLHMTLSIGIADDRAHEHHERMLAEADSRLYAAKAAGRNRVIAE